MGIKTYKPTTPSRRFMAISDFSDITCTKPEKSLLGSTSVDNFFDKEDCWHIAYNTITVPIRAGNFFKVKFMKADPSFFDAQVFLEWIPIIPST